MKRIFYTTIILVHLVMLKPAPSEVLAWQRTAPPPPPPPSNEYFPERWQNYVSEAGRFRIRFPGKPKEPVSTDASNGLVSTIVSYSGILDYVITYLDLPDLINDPAKQREVVNKMPKAILDEVRKDNEPRVLKEGESDLKGHPGYFMHAEIGGSAVARIKCVLVGTRLYSIVADGRKGSPVELEGKDDFEKMAMAFINSFDPIQK